MAGKLRPVAQLSAETRRRYERFAKKHGILDIDDPRIRQRMRGHRAGEHKSKEIKDRRGRTVSTSLSGAERSFLSKQYKRVNDKREKIAGLGYVVIQQAKDRHREMRETFKKMTPSQRRAVMENQRKAQYKYRHRTISSDKYRDDDWYQGISQIYEEIASENFDEQEFEDFDIDEDTMRLLQIYR